MCSPPPRASRDQHVIPSDQDNNGVGHVCCVFLHKFINLMLLVFNSSVTCLQCVRAQVTVGTVHQRVHLCAGIPEDPQAAEVYYNQDGFDSCSEDEESETPAETLYLSEPQVSQILCFSHSAVLFLNRDPHNTPVNPDRNRAVSLFSCVCDKKTKYNLFSSLSTV